ncbi:hypothetical protein [Streptomyces sp. BBFR102]|uniref:hypothetical protein n=1 Tax=Streptomyces sp. BBFR102 TaxID=3448171 RepID=UPI003F530989
MSVVRVEVDKEALAAAMRVRGSGSQEETVADVLREYLERAGVRLDEPAPLDAEDTADQAAVASALLDWVAAPVTEDTFVRGVLPVLSAPVAVRVVVGAEGAVAPDELAAYEVRLDSDGHPVSWADIVGALRAVRGRTAFYGRHELTTVMGMATLTLDPLAERSAPLTAEEQALLMLRTFRGPWSAEESDPRLRGFLFLGGGRLRLYFDGSRIPGVVAADIRTAEAGVGLAAELPGRLEEEDRRLSDPADPHCDWRVDLTEW